jgi:hypothetical protein
MTACPKRPEKPSENGTVSSLERLPQGIFQPDRLLFCKRDKWHLNWPLHGWILQY